MRGSVKKAAFESLGLNEKSLRGYPRPRKDRRLQLKKDELAI